MEVKTASMSEESAVICSDGQISNQISLSNPRSFSKQI